MVKLLNETTGDIIAYDVRTAYSFFNRLCGLMFTKSFCLGDALHIKPCRSIHTFFMNYPIDVLYLDEQNVVIGMDEQIPPYKIGTFHKKAQSVVELPAGSVKRLNIQLNHCLFFET